MARGDVLCSHPSYSLLLPSEQQWVRRGQTDGGTVMSAPSNKAFSEAQSQRQAGTEECTEEREHSLGQDSNPQSLDTNWCLALLE